MPSLKNTCTKFDIPVPPRGYWAKLQAGKPTAKAVLPARAPGMSDEIHLGDRYYWQRSLTDEELLGSLPDRPEFSEDITLVRERIEKAIGTFKVGRVLTIKHPAVLKLLAQDEARREKQKTATYAFSWEKPVLDTPFEQRRLRLLNALFLAVARCGGKAEVRGPEAREVTITVHQTAVFLTLDRPKVTRRGAAQGFYPTGSKSDPLRLAITEGYQREEERAAWQDSEDGPLERLMAEIAVEIVTAAELKYREGCVRQFEWRAKRKAEREEELRQRQLELERQERERQQRLEQARIDRLLDEAATLRRATEIRAYVHAVKQATTGGEICATTEEVERWAQWALAEADRIDPVRNGRFLETPDRSFSRVRRTDSDSTQARATATNTRGVRCGAARADGKVI
ncbi:hypothetical protein IVB25_20905 [Bradyrhizobium sp. 193]|uniref:hypothetical protein n=1 Tax=Bradyrhizobium sp. 193 TaxID=2782661 RepID=UPI001FFAD219|nr:hypothetical protein [Bradyrhizobium sp. 193]MCK1485080.1 hypothetical protein [Bradyrhizobium sp. 193]